MEIQSLKAVDSVEIVILVDNYVDLLLAGSDQVKRPLLAKDGLIGNESLVAEHGLALLVTVHIHGDAHSILLDTGYNRDTVRHNMRLLGLKPDNLEAVVLSHGHMDHTGGLDAILEDLPGHTKVIVHPTAFSLRHLNLPSGDRVTFPPMPGAEHLKVFGADLVENVGPLKLAEGTVLVTGQIPRVTSFETGLPGAMRELDGELVTDTIEDDQSLVISLGEKGLVVISGCAHSGIVNSVLYAQELTGMSRIHSVIGGFHLTGQAVAPMIEPTIREMKKLSPEFIMPMHCTGPEAVQRFAQEFPDSFVRSSVGTRLILSG
jgi:7,8-dihydropterin-6-yl-methyl-4-(beta-D-ribofuranosyl)aminobenzene 5'-phosphate synthase